MTNKKNLSMLLACLIGTTFLGCGAGGGIIKIDTVPVKGSVTLDGAAKSSGQVTFTPVREGKEDDRPEVIGTIAADGTFTLTTYEEGDGAAPGKYTVKLGSGGGGASGSTDPADMMAMMGGGGGDAVPLDATIPKEGTDSLELKFTGAGPKKKAKPGAILGS